MECNADRFPEGLRVLVVDDDPICLLIVERLLRSCLYQVTTCEEAVIALSMLRENRSRFDVVISDVHMPNMDGFKLLELVRLEMDVPVIMMSANGETSSVMKGISQGACDYLLKPVRIEELQNIWQHVVRKKQTVSKGSGFAGTPKDCQQPRQIQADGETAVADEENGFCSSLKKRKEVKDEDTENEEEDNLGSVKRQRVVWSEGLHQKFVTAVNQLGLEQAVPKRILDLMNVPGLTRENVASHLQKFRLYLKRISGSVNQQAGMASCIEASIDSFAWINGHSDRQSVCQLPKLLVTPQLGTGGRLDAFNGGEMHCNESSPVNQLAAELRMDHRDLLMPQCFDPAFQGQGSVEPVLEDRINVQESEFMPSPGQLNTFSQNSSERLMPKQCHRVPHLRGSDFSGGLNYGEIGHSSTGCLSTHQFHVAQPQSQSNILSSLNGLAGQQGFEEFSTESMRPPVDCCTKKGLENSGLFPPSRSNNDCLLFETFHRDSKSNSNAWPSAPSRTFTLTMPCMLEDASIFSIPKAVNEDEVRWRMNNNFLSSSDMNNVKVVCPQLGRQFLRSQELELKEKEGPDLSLSMQAISGKQDVHASFMDVPSSNREKPLYSNSYADPGWSHAFHDAVVEELPTERVAVFKQDQVLR